MYMYTAFLKFQTCIKHVCISFTRQFLTAWPRRNQKTEREKDDVEILRANKKHIRSEKGVF